MAFVETDDLISIDIHRQTLDIAGFNRKRKNPEEINRTLKKRADSWKGFKEKKKGVRGLFTCMAGPTQKGASMYST